MKKIKEIRIRSGFSQNDLAFFLGITRGALSMLETGKRKPCSETLLRTAILEDCINNSTSELNIEILKQNIVVPEHKEAKEDLNYKLQKCRYHIAMLRRRMENEKLKEQKTETLVRVLDQLSRHTTIEHDEWVKHRKHQASLKLIHLYHADKETQLQKLNRLKRLENSILEKLEHFNAAGNNTG